MPTAVPRALLGASILACLSTPALAQTSPTDLPEDDPPPTQIEEIIVVGRADQPITIAPRGLSVSLGQTEFDAINAVNVEDLMKYAPNFFVRKRYIGDANGVPGFRGTHSTQSARTLVMVDGFTVSNLLGNSFSFAPKWGVVGPGEVRQFDIVYGPYSARYPGNSMGGIVSITTRPPRSDEAYAVVQGFAQPYRQYGTDETYAGYSAEAGIGFADTDARWSGRVSFRRLDNVGHPQTFRPLAAVPASGGTTVTGAQRDGQVLYAGAASPDHTVQHQLRARMDFDPGGDVTLQGLFALWNSSSEGDEPQSYLREAGGAMIYEGPVIVDGRSYLAPAAPLQSSDRLEFLTGLKLAGTFDDWTLTANLSRFWIERQRARASNSYASGLASGAGTLTRSGDIGWTTLDLLAERRAGAHKLAFGGSANLYETAQTSFATVDWRRGTSAAFTAETAGKTSVLGLFAEDEIALGDAFSLTVGVRYERWRAFDGRIGRPVGGAPISASYDDRRDDALSPKLSLQWAPADDWQLQLSLATATRFPTVGELFQGRLDSQGSFDSNSFDPNLKPERSRDANLIVRHRTGPVRLTASLFYQGVEDTIFSLQGLNQFGVLTSSFKNIDVVRQYGVELIAEASDVLAPGLNIDANLAWIDAETVRNAALPASEGVRFPRIPAWRANANVRYAVSDALSLSLGARYASRPNSDLAGLERGDTYGFTSELFIVDARVTFDLTNEAQLSLGVDNLNNDRAWVFHPYPQRTVLIELRWKP